jgi:hypothetical protein
VGNVAIGAHSRHAQKQGITCRPIRVVETLAQSAHVLRARRTAAIARAAMSGAGIALVLIWAELAAHPGLAVAGFASIIATSAVQLLVPDERWLKIEESVAGTAGLLIVGLGDHRALVSGIEPGSPLAALVEALVGYAERTSSRLVAEGVETREELEVLTALGVQLIQGYYFGRPAAPWPELAVDVKSADIHLTNDLTVQEGSTTVAPR